MVRKTSVIYAGGGITTRALKLHVISDLHIEHGGFIAPNCSVDAVVVAGDLADGPHVRKALRDLRKQVSAPILYVPGNHDWYGLDVVTDRQKHLDDWASVSPDIQVLDDATWTFTRDDHRWRIIGSTWWSAMAWKSGLDSSVPAEEFVTDFHVIRAGGRRLKAVDVQAFHARSTAFLAAEIRNALASGETPVVVTHYPPAPECGHPSFAGDALNAYFLNDEEHLTEGVALWIYGHVHNSWDHLLPNGCRLLSNPKGYRWENEEFQSDLVIEVPPLLLNAS